MTGDRRLHLSGAAADRYARRQVATHEEILKALGRVIDPELRKPVTELGMVRDVQIDGGAVAVTIALTVVGCPLRSSFEDQVQQHIAPLPGVVSVSLQFDVMSPDERAALTTKLRGGSEVRGIQLPATTRVLAVASGKGGVGKSTLTVNIAAALAARGHEVGVLDADIYGHSIPHMLGIGQRPVVVDKMIVPPVAHDLKLMSIGFFLDDNQPVMWRGPMLHRAFEQFLQDVHWGDLDVLVVDMPPGTGDAQLTMAQATPLAGAVIVSTPQDLALIDARRGVAMFRRVEVPILGVVENMATFVCPHCGIASHIFGHGGARKEAARLGVPFLGEVPLNMTIRETSDAGRPVVAIDPNGPQARAYAEIAKAVWQGLSGGTRRAAPRIVIE
ncbi:MAG: Mrp/NBP35 family ATP-binding protein [Microvirga sp.]